MSGCIKMACLSSRRRHAALWLAAALLLRAGATRAVDLDVTISDSARRDAVAPHCAALLKKRGSLSPQDAYRKGLCLLYGIRTGVRTAEGSNLLRIAADDGVVEAQIALGDTLQKGEEADQRLALIWYERADLSGDTRARARAFRLRQRLGVQADAKGPGSNGAAPEAPANTIVDPSDAELQQLRSAGYHCHMRFGQQWCHDTME